MQRQTPITNKTPLTEDFREVEAAGSGAGREAGAEEVGLELEVCLGLGAPQAEEAELSLFLREGTPLEVPAGAPSPVETRAALLPPGTAPSPPARWPSSASERSTRRQRW